MIKKNIIKKLLSVIFMLTVFGCAKSSKDSDPAGGPSGGNGNRQKQNPVDLSSLPSEYNPSSFEEKFSLQNINQIYFDMFGFKNDVEIVYSNSLSESEGFVKIYTAEYDSEQSSVGSLSTERKNNKRFLSRSGMYACSINIENRKITKLKGLCFLRMEIHIPAGSQIEVYNVQELLTKRYFAVDNATLLMNYKKASYTDDKKAVIEDFLNSYEETNQTPVLYTYELASLLEGFSFATDKFETLEKLQSYISDRNKLSAMIDEEFNYFDREKARKICEL